MKQKIIYEKREFLNKDLSYIGAISANVELINYHDEEDENNLYYTCIPELVISDCNRSLTFSFSIDDEKDYENSMYKLNILLNTLSEFKDSLEEARKVLLEYEKFKKLDKENNKS